MRNPFSRHKAAPNGGDDDTYSSSIETYTYQELSTIDINESLPAQSGGLGVENTAPDVSQHVRHHSGPLAMQVNTRSGTP